MQSRFWISTHNEYEKAAKVKRELAEKNTDKVYQIRKGKEGSRIVFRLVERLTRSEAEIINERRNPTGYTKKPSKRQRREREISSILH